LLAKYFNGPSCRGNARPTEEEIGQAETEWLHPSAYAGDPPARSTECRTALSLAFPPVIVESFAPAGSAVFDERRLRTSRHRRKMTAMNRRGNCLKTVRSALETVHGS
jgi:hypothetical protein